MRVTNERAQSAIKAHHITGNLTNIVKDYAADLLEARDLIKEMRNALEIVRDNTHNPAHTLTNLGLESVVVSCYTLAIKTLEKSKDYA